MQDPPLCALCNRPIPCGEGYIVKIEVFADPQLPPMTMDQINAADLNSSLADLNQQIQNMSAEDLQDGVHRSFTHHLCARCHKTYLANPLGIPRVIRVSDN